MNRVGFQGKPLTAADKPIAKSKLVLFALPEYAIYLGSIPVGLYLPLVYSKDFGLELADVGLILILARVSDVITDPLIGYLSDRTKGRFGRRKPWMAAGALLMAASAFLLFNPPGAVSNFYLLECSVGLWLGWTLINIPYYAWGAELSDSYHERTRITGWRQAFAFLGNVSVLTVPVIAGEITGYGALPREGLAIIGFMALVALPVMIATTLATVPERKDLKPVRSPWWRNAGAMLKNGSFMLLFFGFLLQALGTGWGSATFMLFATFVVQAEASSQAILLGYFGANIISLPFWIALAQRVGKKQTWIAGGVLFVFVTPLFLFLEGGDLGWFFLVLALYGIAGGNFSAMSMSMKADVIEIASRRSGEDIAGSYIAVWSLGQKLVAALGLGALPLLQMLDFSATGGNSPEAIRMLSYVYVLPPWLCYALAVVVIWRYPISAERLARIRRRFDRRDARRAAIGSHSAVLREGTSAFRQ